MGANTNEHRHEHGDNWMDHVWACKESCNIRMFIQGNNWCYKWSRSNNDLDG